MKNSYTLKNLFALLFISFLASCQTQNTSTITAITGARLIDGNGATPIENAVLLIDNGRVLAAGSKEEIAIPENATLVDATGKTIIPGLINAHAHVGYRDQVNAAHYSAEQIQNQLELYARFGITTVASLGTDLEQARAFQAINDTTEAIGRARLYIAGNIIEGNSTDGVKAMVDENAANKVDFIKFKVDNNRGRTEAMPSEIYKAIIDHAHENGLRTTTHLYDLQIAKDLLNAGTDFIAHSVRDQVVDAEFATLLKTKNVCYCPTLTRDLSTFVYGDTAAFFSDPFFIENANTSEVAALNNPDRQTRTRSGGDYNANQAALKMAIVNLGKLNEAGATIAMGTDSGMPNRFQGYFEHLEMELMAEAGMTAMQILVASTSAAAKCLRLKDVGSLTNGNLADFVILDANPLENISNTKSISSVWVGGEELKK